jgi:hypothetical protein
MKPEGAGERPRRRITVRLLPRRYIDDRFSELVGVSRALRGCGHNISPVESVAHARLALLVPTAAPL